MKKNSSGNLILLAVIGIYGSVLYSSCHKDDKINNTHQYSVVGTASGDQEVPVVVTNGSATLTGTYNSDSNLLHYVITWTNLSDSVTGASINGPAMVGVNADALITINPVINGSSGNASGNILLADSTENFLFNKKLYYNLKTLLNPLGEVRGQVSVASE
jgi:hypothetical protein